MQILKTLTLSLLVSASLLSVTGHSQMNNQVNASATKYPETPAKTIIIKHPGANDLATFFATTNVLSFEIYKPGDIAGIRNALKKDANVEACTAGNVTGDYHQVNLVVKAAKDKAWYAALFKKAGLNTIKVNNNPIVEVEKM